MQRTLFPAIPNTAEAQWLSTVQALYQELDRNGGQQPFKLFRGWMRDRNIYVKEEAEALLDFLDCDSKPNVSLRHFAKTYLECDTPQAQKVTMFRWLMGWNPLLVKSVFEALDTEAGGRLHSTHELYRMITSYAFAGEHITLPSFQAWIKWMAATEHIRYIGIRWGLGDLGKQALPNIKHIDVDEVLEEEEEAREAGVAEVHPMLAGVAQAPPPAVAAADVAEAPQDSVSTPTAPDDSAPASLHNPSDAPEHEDLPDMPPEPVPPPVDSAPGEPVAMPAAPTPKVAPVVTAQAPVSIVQSAPVAMQPAAQAAWFPAAPSRDEISAPDLGFDAKQYGADPALFSFRLACAARLLVSGLPSSVWQELFKSLDTDGFFERYFAKKRPMEEILQSAKWLHGSPHRAALSWVVVDVMELRVALEARPGYADQLEQRSPAEALYSVHHELFGAAIDGASAWYAREMTRLELWES